MVMPPSALYCSGCWQGRRRCSTASTTSTRAASCRSATSASRRAPEASLRERRLLILSPTTGRGGAEDYILTVADAALDAGWEVTVCLECVAGTRTVVDDLRGRPRLRYLDRLVSSGVYAEL